MKKINLMPFFYEVKHGNTTLEYSTNVHDAISAFNKSMKNGSEVKMYRMHRGTGVKSLLQETVRVCTGNLQVKTYEKIPTSV